MAEFDPLKPRPMTPEQVAERRDCSPNHVRVLIREGKLRAFKVGTRLLRVPLDAVAEYEATPMELPLGPPPVTPTSEFIVLTHSQPRRR